MSNFELSCKQLAFLNVSIGSSVGLIIAYDLAHAQAVPIFVDVLFFMVLGAAFDNARQLWRVKE